MQKTEGIRVFFILTGLFVVKTVIKRIKKSTSGLPDGKESNLVFVICFIIILLIVFFESGKSNKKNDNENNGSMTEQVQE